MRFLVAIATLAASAGALSPAALGGSTSRFTTVEAAPGQQIVSSERRFTLAGVHWQGPGSVVFRTRSLEGRWSDWREAAPEDEDGPDRGSLELRPRAGWRIGNPWWVGPSDRIETRAIGRVTRVRAHLVWSPETRVPYRVPAATGEPSIVPRLSWGADESIRRAPPTFAPDIRFAVVHHTAGRNDYSRAEAAAIVKGIQLYHVQGNGWNDIGYNFLVDRFGTIYEGRFGGVTKNVVGAHAQGFNTGSVGVALLGTYGSTTPTQAAQDAIAGLLAWRLDLAHLDPTGITTFISGGSSRFASGIPVLLRGVSGHRDTGFTECPGNLLYSRLNGLASAAAAIGLPKVYEPRVEATEGVFRFQARLSSPLPWVVTVTDTAGLEVARGTGTSTAVDWSWDSSLATPGSYTWSIRSGSARPPTGQLRVGTGTATLAVEATATPTAISPNGDGQADTASLDYGLTAAANVTVAVVDANGIAVATIVDRVWTHAGRHSVAVDGTAFPDGIYRLVLTARTAAGVQVQKVLPLTVSRTLGLVSVAPALFSPNRDGRNDSLEVSFSLTAAAGVSVRIVRDERWVATPLFASYLSGPQRFVWDGTRASGPLRDGTYSAVVEATDAVVGTTS
ncbi:MAG: N-acetylmuramoyl-L-alanine amidase, partial [Gaiellaceae bacterium]